MDTSFDQAKRCPRCESPGMEEPSRPGPHRSRLHVFRCMNPRCRWQNTTWIVQVNADGTIPPPDAHRQKQFPKVSDRTESVDRQMQNLLNQSLSRGEIRG